MRAGAGRDAWIRHTRSGAMRPPAHRARAQGSQVCQASRLVCAPDQTCTLTCNKDQSVRAGWKPPPESSLLTLRSVSHRARRARARPQCQDATMYLAKNKMTTLTCTGTESCQVRASFFSQGSLPGMLN